MSFCATCFSKLYWVSNSWNLKIILWMFVFFSIHIYFHFLLGVFSGRSVDQPIDNHTRSRKFPAQGKRKPRNFGPKKQFWSFSWTIFLRFSLEPRNVFFCRNTKKNTPNLDRSARHVSMDRSEDNRWSTFVNGSLGIFRLKGVSSPFLVTF